MLIAGHSIAILNGLTTASLVLAGVTVGLTLLLWIARLSVPWVVARAMPSHHAIAKHLHMIEALRKDADWGDSFGGADVADMDEDYHDPWSALPPEVAGQPAPPAVESESGIRDGHDWPDCG